MERGVALLRLTFLFFLLQKRTTSDTNTIDVYVFLFKDKIKKKELDREEKNVERETLLFIALKEPLC